MIETTKLIYFLLMLSSFVGGVFTAIGIGRYFKKRTPIKAKDIIDPSVEKEFKKLNKELEKLIKLNESWKLNDVILLELDSENSLEDKLIELSSLYFNLKSHDNKEAKDLKDQINMLVSILNTLNENREIEFKYIIPK